MINGFEVMQFCRMYMQAKKECNLRYSQLCVLNILCAKPGVYTPMMLAGVLNVSRPMITAHLKALLHDGYITRVASPDDGRSV
ncbi:MAG: winged helix-turn-helix transcriptional regulator, partial [Alphaproteobacteria bacterium]|nr:winged helix-turn-helix transcriptional regulator [Alphaproteobacteria bacterium]